MPNDFCYNRKYLLEKRKYMTQMIDGKALAAKLQGQLAEKTAKLKEETGLVPGLGRYYSRRKSSKPSLRTQQGAFCYRCRLPK